MKTLITILLALLATSAIAQRDSTTGAWMQARTHDGKLWHDLPPPANVVHAGMQTVHASRMKDRSLLFALIGGAAGGVLWTQNEHVGKAVVGVSLGMSLVYQFKGNRSQRHGGVLLMSGYQITERYELVPDSVDVGPHMRIAPIK
jgi:hypothetical protein